MTNLSRYFLSFFLTITSTSLLACGGGGGTSDGGGSSSSTIFEGVPACSVLGLKSSAKIANGELCPVNGRGDTTSLVEVEPLLYSIPEGVCSGTVISPTAVLTAAHCFADATNATITTVVNGQRIRVPGRSVSVHPGVDLSSNGLIVNDVAIVHTAKAMTAPRAAILLSRRVEKGEGAMIGGFGQTSPSDSAAEQLYAGRAVIKNATDDHIRIDFTSDQSHPCYGDSGGALFVKEGDELAIAGVVSQSDPSVSENNICKVGDKTLYTNIEKSAVASFVLSEVPDAIVK